MSKEEFDLIAPHLPKNGSLLEIGSYPFERTKDLIDLEYDVKGVDIRFEKPEYNVKKCDIELESLPFKDNSFDIVLMMEVFEHLGRNPVFALLEIRRVLKPGGTFIMSTPNFYLLRNFAWIIFKGKQREMLNYLRHMKQNDYQGHIRTYSKKELLMFFDYVGLTVKRHQYLWYKANRFTIGGIITYLIPSFREHHLFICEKSC
jgi:SAM-dependent methyltransferase